MGGGGGDCVGGTGVLGGRGVRVRVGRGVLEGMIRVLVGRGVRLAITRVLVGRGVMVGLRVLVGRGVTVLVRVGIRVGVNVRVGVALGWLVANVPLTKTKGVGVRVAEGVRVTVGEGVMDAVSVGVRVGPVAVGKGPKSAAEVSAIAVRVPRALDARAATPGDALKAIHSHTPIRRRHKRTPSSTCGRSAYSFQREYITGFLHFAPGRQDREDCVRTGNRDCYDRISAWVSTGRLAGNNIEMMEWLCGGIGWEDAFRVRFACA